MDPSCGGSYCYVVTPGTGTAQSLDGAFWAFGFGSPTSGAGVDDGSSTLDSWLFPAAGGRYLMGDWTASGIDGCASGHIAPGKPAEIMVAEIEDGGVSGFFAIAAVRRFMSHVTEYDFTFAADGGPGQAITLVAIPKARMTSSTRDQFVFAGPDPAVVTPGVFTDGSVTADELVKGYRVFEFLPHGTTPTGLKKSAGWSPITATVPLGQDVTVTWDGQTPRYYAYGLVFDSAFETSYVGAYIRVSSFCDGVADLDGDGFPDAFGNPECCPDPVACDCNDANPAVHPGALEVCNGIDDNCDGIVDNVALPGPPALLLDKIPGGAHLSWGALAVATGYDVVRGDLQTLVSSGGDYAASTKVCLANDATTTTFDDADAPAPGAGMWYLLRASNCTGLGSYDGPDASQAVRRDPGIAASGHSCP